MDSILISTAYLPPIDYIKAIVDAHNTEIEFCENFQKRSYRNRAVILSANGSLSLSIPVKKPNGNHTPVSEIVIDYSESWQHDHWQAIQSAYNKSPFFEYYSYLFEPFYQKKWCTLMEYNTDLLKAILKILSIHTPISFTDKYAENPIGVSDYRDLFKMHKSGTSIYTIPPYNQVFEYKFPFDGKISILDTLFNLGPDTGPYLLSMKEVWFK